jgi:hypothetical protein
MEILKMLQGVLFIFAGASLFGLTGFLFRDEITRDRWLKGSADWGSTAPAKPIVLPFPQRQKFLNLSGDSLV